MNLEKTNVPLVRVILVILAVSSGSLWVGKYMERVDNRMTSLEAQVNRMSGEISNLAQRIAFR